MTDFTKMTLKEMEEKGLIEEQLTIDVSKLKGGGGNAAIINAIPTTGKVLIGVGIEDPHVSGILQDFKDKAQLTQYIEAGAADAKTLAKIAGFISQSISSQSQALSSGGPSQPIAF